VNWVDKTAQPITQCCQVLIHISRYENRVWCDVLDIETIYILLGRPCLYDLDKTSLNTYEFKFNGKKIVLKPAKPKLNVGNNEGTITDNKTPCYLMTRSHFSPESPIDGSTPKCRNSLGLSLFP